MRPDIINIARKAVSSEINRMIDLAGAVKGKPGNSRCTAKGSSCTLPTWFLGMLLSRELDF